VKIRSGRIWEECVRSPCRQLGRSPVFQGVIRYADTTAIAPRATRPGGLETKRRRCVLRVTSTGSSHLRQKAFFPTLQTGCKMESRTKTPAISPKVGLAPSSETPWLSDSLSLGEDPDRWKIARPTRVTTHDTSMGLRSSGSFVASLRRASPDIGCLFISPKSTHPEPASSHWERRRRAGHVGCTAPPL
jgi:hypothetical protein